MEVPAIQVFKNYGHDVYPPEPQSGCIHAVPQPLRFVEMIFDTLIMGTCLGGTRLINIKIICCGLDLGETGSGESMDIKTLGRRPAYVCK